MKKKKFDWKIVILIILVGIFLFVWLQRNREEKTIAEAILPPVKVMKPEFGEIRQELRLNGYVQSETMVTVLPKISGTLTDLFVNMGDPVKKSQIIAKVDSEPYELTLQQTEAAFLTAESTYLRTEKLYKAQATSKQNYDQAKGQYETLKSQYELAKLQMKYTDIVSPVDGVVLTKHSSVGALVSSQVPIVTIGDIANLSVTVDVPEKYYTFFEERKDGLSISAVIPGLNNRRIRARINAVAPYIAPETKTFRTVCSFTGDTTMVRPGMFANMTFLLAEKEKTYYLPFKTLVGGSSLWYADAPENGTGTAETIVFIPEFFNEEYFALPDEYQDKLFIIEGQHFLRKGQRVRIMHEDS